MHVQHSRTLLKDGLWNNYEIKLKFKLFAKWLVVNLLVKLILQSHSCITLKLFKKYYFNYEKTVEFTRLMATV